MPHKSLSRVLAALFVAALAGCQLGRDVSSAIQNQFVASERKAIDLAVAVPSDWERVCILGPYSDNASAANALGFAWDAESKSSIESNEGVSLLLFVQNNKVVAHAEHPRSSGDFTNLTGRCFAKANAKFVQVAQPRRGRAGLFPPDEA